MVGSFSDDEWNDLYRKVYEHLEPGGWIEQCEFGVSALSDDGTLDPDGYITKWVRLKLFHIWQQSFHLTQLSLHADNVLKLLSRVPSSSNVQTEPADHLRP